MTQKDLTIQYNIYRTTERDNTQRTTDTETLNNQKDLQMYKIKTTRQTTTAHDIESNVTAKAPKFIKTLAIAQIDMKQINAYVYAMAVEEADTNESFIAEHDINKDGLSKEHQEQKLIIEEMTARAVEIKESELMAVIAQYQNKGDLLFSTEWNNDRGNMSIRTKYLFDETDGIIVKELKTQPSKESYTVAIPSVRGLYGFRMELLEKYEGTDEHFNDLRTLHNNHCLLINDIEPETDIFEDLSEVREDEPTSKFYGKGGIFINYKDGFITGVKNDKLSSAKAQKSQKRRDF